MKRFSVILLVGSLLSAAEPEAWIVPPPQSRPATKEIELPRSDVFEVVASMSANAQFELRTQNVIVLSEAAARNLTGHYYSCPKGKRPYLVRGVFGFAGTGRFHVRRIAEAIWVSHESLGRGWTSSRTALVVNLDFEPTTAYATVDIIE